MKAKVTESTEWLDIQLEAETAEEATMLTRYGLNAKKEKPYINLSLNDNSSFIRYNMFIKGIEIWLKDPML